MQQFIKPICYAKSIGRIASSGILSSTYIFWHVYILTLLHSNSFEKSSFFDLISSLNDTNQTFDVKSSSLYVILCILDRLEPEQYQKYKLTPNIVLVQF